MYCYTCEEESRARKEGNPQQAHLVPNFIFQIEDIVKHDMRHRFESLQGYYEGKMQGEITSRCSEIEQDMFRIPHKMYQLT